MRVTLTGSLVAFAKLQELMSGKPITFPGQNASNLIVFLADRWRWRVGRFQPKFR